jgi:23S rRNA (uracil1939-C5)-methyltransferase
VSFVLRREDDTVRAGYHDASDPDRIVDVESCPLAEPAINRVWKALRDGWGEGAAMLPKGRELRLTLRATTAGEVGLAIEGGGKSRTLDTLVDGVDGLSAIWSILRDGTVEGAGAPTLGENIGDHEVALAGTAFLQVNREMGARLDAYVNERCGEVRGLSVVDAYCGFGVRAVDMARREAAVTGIDADRYAIATAGALATSASVAPRLLADTVERALPKYLPADIVVLNPPRRGVGSRALEALLRKPPARIVYVSCDPATLARDLRALSDGFGLDSCRAFDLFPQTAHVETVVALSPRG